MKSLTLTLALSLAALVSSAAPPVSTHPNIIFILTDDLGWGDIGVLFQNGRQKANVRSEPWELTPHLDRFAAEGALLPHHYCAAPVCAPSRASLLLGVSQGHANVRDNQFDKALENNHNLASVLHTAGYSTVAVGKWGLQGEGKGLKDPNTWPAYPTKRGFDHFFGYVRHKDGHEHYPKEGLYDGKKEVWDDNKEVSADLDKCYTADLWTAWAKHWIVEHEKSQSAQPFFMYLAYDTPHAVTELPTQAYPEGGGLHGGMQWLGTPGHMISSASGEIDSWIHPDFRDATWDDDHNPATPEVAWPEVYKRYATAVRRVDDAVGDIEKLLQDLHIDENTMVIFTSDNGPSIESYLPKRPFAADFFKSFGPFDGIKRDCLEGGLRVPTMARWPSHIPAGKIINRPSINYDWLRTLAEAASLPAPARADGVSLLPELTGQPGQQDPGYLYVEYFNNGKSPNYADFVPQNRGRLRNQMQTLRMGDYVGLRYNIKSQNDLFEIYHVTEDPKESHNLAAQMPELEKQMHQLFLQARRPDPGARRPYDNELIPAAAVASVTNGVEWKAYEGNYPWVPDFQTLKAVTTGMADKPSVEKKTRDKDIGLWFIGFIKVPQDGDYTFSLAMDQDTPLRGAVLRIHDATVIDADYGTPGGEEANGSIRLQAGLHPFRLHYARGSAGIPALALSWTGPGIAKEPIPAGAFFRATAKP